MMKIYGINWTETCRQQARKQAKKEASEKEEKALFCGVGAVCMLERYYLLSCVRSAIA